MATKATANRLVLKVAVVLDDAQLKKAAQDGQKTLDKQFDKTLKNATDGTKKFKDGTEKTNKALTQQKTIIGQMGVALGNMLKRMVQTTAAGLLFWKVIGSAKEAIRLTIELDTAYTNLSIVSKITAQQMQVIDERVNELTSSLGRMKKEVIDSITEFSRAGFTISDSLLLAENAIKGANVGATSLEKVTTFLVAGLKSFKMEAEGSARILDVLFRVANTTAINLEGVGEAFLRSANTLNTAGASLEQSAALIAAANESIQDPAKVGTALKTIASRLRGVGDEGEVIPTLARDFEAVGISLQNADGSFRNIYDIFQDLSRVYKDLDDLTRQSLFEKIAGKRQINILIGLLDNFEVAEKAFDNALKSAGEVALAQEKYVNSLQGKVNLLKEAWEQFLRSIIDGDGLKVFIDGLTGMANAITFILTKMPLLIAGFAALTAISIANPIGIAVASVVAAGFTLSTVMSVFKSEADKAAEKVVELSASIEGLQGKINKLTTIPIEQRTEAQKEYLRTLEAQIQAEKDLLDIQNRKVFEGGFSDAITADNKVQEVVEQVKNATTQFKELGEALPLTAIEQYNKRLKTQEENLLRLRASALASREETTKGSKSYEILTDTLSQLDESLKDVYEGYDALGIVYTDLFNDSTDLAEETVVVKTKLDDLRESIESAKTNTEGLTGEYRLLSEAYIQLSKNGSISSEMLEELLSKFPDLITETGLAEDAMLGYLEALGENSRKIHQDAIQDIKDNIEAIKLQTEAYWVQQRFLDSIDRDPLLGERMSPFGGTFDGFNPKEAFKEITNGLNQIGKLENSNPLFDLIDDEREEELRGAVKKEIRVLTELESQIRKTNNEIDMQQKLLARTENAEEQIVINQRLIELTKQLKDQLIAQKAELDNANKSLKRGQDGYEDYIDATMKLSLEIEDATNNIVGFGKAIEDIEADKEAKRLEVLKDEIKSINETFQDDLKAQIDLQKDLAKQRADYYKTEIENKQKEIEALQEQNQEIDDQIRLQELLLNLQTLRERRQNILDNKNVRVVRDADTGFEWVSDPRELKQVNEDIANAEQAIDKFRRDMLVKENTRRLELEIEGLERRAQAEQDSFDARISELENFQNEVNDAISNNLPIPVGLVQTLQDNLQSVENTSYGIRLSLLSSFIADYNSRMAQMDSPPIVPTNVSAPAMVSSASSILNNTSSGTSKSSGASSSTGGVKTSTPSASSVAKKVAPTTVNTKAPINVNTVNVTSTSRTVDAIVTDAINKVKVMSY